MGAAMYIVSIKNKNRCLIKNRDSVNKIIFDTYIAD